MICHAEWDWVYSANEANRADHPPNTVHMNQYHPNPTHYTLHISTSKILHVNSTSGHLAYTIPTTQHSPATTTPYWNPKIKYILDKIITPIFKETHIFPKFVVCVP